jgi:hypothetical protein
MSKEVKRQKARSCSRIRIPPTHSHSLPQVGFSGSDAMIKDEADASPSIPEVAAMPALSNLGPQQYRALLQKRFSENKDNVLGVLGTYKDRLEGELQFLTRSVLQAGVQPMRNLPFTCCPSPSLSPAVCLPPVTLSSAGPPPAENPAAAPVGMRRRRRSLLPLVDTHLPPRMLLIPIATTRAPTATDIAPLARMTSARPLLHSTMAIRRLLR